MSSWLRSSCSCTNLLRAPCQVLALLSWWPTSARRARSGAKCPRGPSAHLCLTKLNELKKWKTKKELMPFCQARIGRAKRMTLACQTISSTLAGATISAKKVSRRSSQVAICYFILLDMLKFCFSGASFQQNNAKSIFRLFKLKLPCGGQTITRIISNSKRQTHVTYYVR